MNNKGTTIVEILVSIILMSIVLIFLFALLSDLKSEDYISNTRTKDALNRIEIIHLIENDMINKKLSQINFSKCSSNRICLEFSFQNDSNKKTLSIGGNYLIYDDEKWQLSSGNYQINNGTYCDTSNGDYHIFKLFIPVDHDAASYRKLSIDLVYISNSAFSITNASSVGLTRVC